MGGVRYEEQKRTLDSQTVSGGTLRGVFRAYGLSTRLVYLCPGADPRGCSDEDTTKGIEPYRSHGGG